MGYHDLKELFTDTHAVGEWLYDNFLHRVDEHFQPGSGELGDHYLHFINEYGDPMSLFENHHHADHSHDHSNYHDHCVDYNNY